MSRLLLVLSCVLAACYRPGADASCALTCNGAESCPGGYACSNGFCALGTDTCSRDGGVIDSITDGREHDAPEGQVCFGTSPIRPCFPIPLPNMAMLGALDTGAGCANVQLLDNREVCVVGAEFIQVSDGTVRVEGSRPLVLVGAQQIVVPAGATIDVSSSTISGHGAGAPSGFCTDRKPGTGTGGGAGGTFAGPGGTGGSGSNGGVGGPGGLVQLPIAFRAGCDGAPNPNGLPGGRGGGAVYLISDGMITMNGNIAAGGSGGSGGAMGEGGAGGGTGGFIGLDSPAIGFGGIRLVATGGGGGGGGSAVVGGLSGGDATIANPTPMGGPGGGAAGGTGGAGGISPTSITNANNGTAPGSAGGGGGGSTGQIRFFRGGTCGSRCFPPAVGP